MSAFQGSISYNSKAGAPAGFINVAGARNGASIDTGNFVVLGQDIGAVGNPAILLNNREIPMGGKLLNWWGGSTVLSDVSNLGANAKLEVYDAFSAAHVNNLALFQGNWTNVNSKGGVTVQINTTSSTSLGSAFAVLRNTGSIFVIGGATGNVAFFDPFASQQYAGFTPSIYKNIALRSSTVNQNLNINSFWHPDATVDPAQPIDIAISSTVILDNVAEVDYYVMKVTSTYQQTGVSNGSFHGIQYAPNISGTLPVMPIAWENQSGDVLLCNTVAGTTNLGRVAIRRPYFPSLSPTAWLEIGAGAAAASSAPLKFNIGVNLTTPEQGAVEFNGTNLFFTPGATRQSVLTGNSGAAAPATTATPVFTSFYGGNTIVLGNPNNWIAVNIGGTTFKIPLYT